MPKEIRNRLTARGVMTIKTPGRHADGLGLYLHVSDFGSRWWIWRGVVRGKRREFGLGSCHLVPLAEARQKAAEFRAIARAGGDPAQARDAARRALTTFEEVARRVWAETVEGHAKNAKHSAQWLTTLQTYAFPRIGARAIASISTPDVLDVLRPIWTSKPETARRVRQRLRTVFDSARVEGLISGSNPVEGVELALARQKDTVRHMPAVPYADAPYVFTRIAAAQGMGARALAFAILTVARSGEVRLATWGEIDVDARVWTIPAQRMKARKDHRVPLSDAAVALLAGLPRVEDLVFPSTKPRKPLSDMTLAAVHKRLGIEAVPHGWRSTFRDRAAETTDAPREVCEAALAHVVGNAVEAAYRRGDLFEKRRALMAEWSSFLTG